jgi:hypothetical protein
VNPRDRAIEFLLLAISDVHSGNAEEGRKIAAIAFDTMRRICPWCGGLVSDDDTIQQDALTGITYHARCKDHRDTAARVAMRSARRLGD